MIIKNARIITCDNGKVIENGFIKTKQGKIIGVCEGDCPDQTDPNEVIYDACGMTVVPGFIDSHCHLGMWEEGLSFEGEDGNEMTDPCTPHLRALDAVNPLDRAFGEALEYGITTVVTGPGSANPVSGQIIAMKTAGKVIDEMLIKAPVAMKFALGENPKMIYSEKSQMPTTRMAIAAIIREQLQKAQRYAEDLERSQQDEDADPPEVDAKCEALLPVLSREIKAHFHAHRADDICTALRIIKEFNLDGVIVHGTEGYMIADTLAKNNIPVICGPIICTRGKPELRNATRDNFAILKRSGVTVALNTDAPELPIDMLLTSLAVATKTANFTMEENLEAVTCNAATVAGIFDRVGSITVGKDADMLIFKDSPVQLLEKPMKVIVNGNFTEI